MDLLKEFLAVAETLNNSLLVTPVLYGSLGLQHVTGLELSPQDIDILVPQELLKARWEELKQTMEDMGYRLQDIWERQFQKGSLQVAFALEEDLLSFAQVDYRTLRVAVVHGVEFKVLEPSDFLKVYTRSLEDGYRQQKNNQKDLVKIQLLQGIIKV